MAPPALAAQTTCPRASGPDAEAGWGAFRNGDMGEARRRFQAALARCPDDFYAKTGLGYVNLREARNAEAEGLLREVIGARPDDVDALVGLGLLAWRRDDLEEVSARFQRVLALVPAHPVAREYLDRLPAGLGPPPEREALVLPDSLVYPARANGDRLEIRGEDGWRPLYIKGVNLGAALPGRNPSEFPDSSTYARWVAEMAELEANAVRVYTIHPPAFYQALREHNLRNPERPLWLIHGVWTELPEEQDHDYLAPEFEEGFFAEMERVVDLVHGRADLRPRPGHASGFYTADVSPWTLAYIIGREWEPFSSLAFNVLRPDFTRWDGRYVTLANGSPMEAWLARASDHLVRYETESYGQQRPVAYTNWPTLDPLFHPTESTREEEVALREALGERVDVRPREYDNDELGLDATRMGATAAFPAGVFASFHAYPYYPDFMVLDPDHGRAVSSSGPSTYFGYLTDLKARHPGIPVVISEYGLPASHGPAHLQPQGMHHGGLTEDAMARGNARLTREIAEAGMAGGVVFAWIDEWFKKNWLVIDFERPAERNRLWYNRLDAEQHYGLIAMEAEPPLAGSTLGERIEAWRGVPAILDGPEGTVRAAHDAAYLWLLIDTPEGAPGDVLHVGFDIVDREAGDRRWPGRQGPRLPVGVEFVLVADGDGVRVLADPPVNPFRLVEVGAGTRARPDPGFVPADAPAGLFQGRVEQRFNVPFRSVANDDGVYEALRVVSNRRRIGRDSTEYLAMGYDRGVLPEGPPPDGFWERHGDVLEVRIPWLLLNVTDPSSRSVLSHSGAVAVQGWTQDGLLVLPSGETVFPDSISGDLDVEQVEEIRLVAAVRRGDGDWRTLGGEEGVGGRFTWPTWEQEDVRWQARRRPTFGVLRDLYRTLDPYGEGAEDTPTEPDTASPQEDPAAVAWRTGDTERALALYLERLAGEPDDAVAMHRVALIRAWSEAYEASLELFDRLIELEPRNVEARVDRAKVLAWRGDVGGALSALDALLDEAPGLVAALEARATFQAWAGRYDDAIATYGQILSIVPDDTGARRQQAQVLSWASRYEASRALYDSLVAEDPRDIDALLGLGRVMTFEGDTRAALDVYGRALELAPEDVRVLQGLARAESWGGDLVQGEGWFRRAVATDPSDVASLVGLAQNLRWQGRNAAAWEVLERAQAVAPADPDVREQLRWVRVALGPQLRPSIVLEQDSDDNRMLSTSLSGSWHPVPRLTLRADGYRRSLDQDALVRSASGLTVSAGWQMEPGWTFSAGVGGSRTDGEGNPSATAWSLGAGSPGRYPVTGTVTVASYALDATALLAERGVGLTEVTTSARWTPAPGWRVDAALGRATFRGSEDNQRSNFSASASRRLGRPWSVGAAIRWFAFTKDLADGYFDPDFYGIAEATGRWLAEPGRWSLVLEAAPGVQRVTTGGPLTGTLRASVRAAFRLAPGRELSASWGYSSTGMQTFSTGSSDYRYRAFGVGGAWLF